MYKINLNDDESMSWHVTKLTFKIGIALNIPVILTVVLCSHFIWNCTYTKTAWSLQGLLRCSRKFTTAKSFTKVTNFRSFSSSFTLYHVRARTTFLLMNLIWAKKSKDTKSGKQNYPRKAQNKFPSFARC